MIVAFQQVQEPLVQGLSALSILGNQLVKDLHAGKTLNTRQILDHVMDSIALLANANFKLNMARRELIKPDLTLHTPGCVKMKLNLQQNCLEMIYSNI